MTAVTQPQPKMSFWQIWNMCFGFLGIQYGFGLQQANLSPIFRYHGANESELPILWLAGPVTGLLIQPLIGAISDRTWTPLGRRKPFYLVGALVGSVAVLFMPYVPALWMAVGLFWILDAAMNTAMEPYRAIIGDSLPKEQQSLGFSMQTFMVAAGQILAGLMPLIMLTLGVTSVAEGNAIPDIVKYSFVVGVVAIISSMTWTALTTRELPPADVEAFKKEVGRKGLISRTYDDLVGAVNDMPVAIRQLWWVKLFCWYGLPLMWQYLALSIARHSFNAPTPADPGFAEGAANAGAALTLMNVTTLLVAFSVRTLNERFGAKNLYSMLLAIGGAGFCAMQLNDALNWVFGCMVLVGIGWAGVMTMPFIIATQHIDAAKNGVYMGLLNAFICLPQILSMLTVGLFYDTLLAGDPRNALLLCGVCFISAALMAQRLQPAPQADL